MKIEKIIDSYKLEEYSINELDNSIIVFNNATLNYYIIKEHFEAKHKDMFLVYSNRVILNKGYVDFFVKYNSCDSRPKGEKEFVAEIYTVYNDEVYNLTEEDFTWIIFALEVFSETKKSDTLIRSKNVPENKISRKKESEIGMMKWNRLITTIEESETLFQNSKDEYFDVNILDLVKILGYSFIFNFKMYIKENANGTPVKRCQSQYDVHSLYTGQKRILPFEALKKFDFNRL